MESTFILKDLPTTELGTTAIHNPWLLDRTISLAAKGLLGQLIYLSTSHQPLTYKNIERLSGHSRKDINAALTSLMEGGYVRGNNG